MKRVLLATAALVAAVAVLTALRLPPKRQALTAWDDGTIPGLLHVHSSRSDGRSSPDEIAAAAARAGLRFLVFTDHGDATREPDPPVYRAGVLCLDGVEISTSGGHYVALGMPAAPFPLAGEPRDVVEDVRRFGGFGIAAHPDSPKKELQWTDWTAPIDGIELINPDSGWREHLASGRVGSRVKLFESLLVYPWRPSETIGNLLATSTDAITHWDAWLQKAPVVGIAGVDAHAKISLLNAEPGNNRMSLAVPGYDPSFRALSVHLQPLGPLSGDAAADAPRVLDALRAGRLYIAVDAWASPPAFTFSAANRRGEAVMGGALEPDGPLTLHVRHNAPSPFHAIVLRDGQPVGTPSREQDFSIDAGEGEGVYRVEIRDGARLPAWLLSNPIRVRRASRPSAPAPLPPPTDTLPLFDGKTTTAWTNEFDMTSKVAIDVAPTLNGAELRMRYALSGGNDIGQFAGAAVDTPNGIAAFNRLTFRARAERPMRISVQSRAQVEGAPPERWQRSIYLDTEMRAYSVPFDEMTAVGITHTPLAPYANVRNLMFIVDTLNSEPGAAGRVWLDDVRLEAVPGLATLR